MSIGERRSGVSGGDDEAARLDAVLPDIDWSVAPVGARFSTFRAPSGDLAVVALGDPADPRVVLVPGATGSKEDFYLLAPILVAAGYYVQSYDLAGQYESASAGPAAGQGYSYDLLVADFVAFLREGGPAHVLGYSFAGILAELALVEHGAVPHPDPADLPAGAGPGVPRSARHRLAELVCTAHQGAGLMIWGIMTNKNQVGPTAASPSSARGSRSPGGRAWTTSSG